jgi:hypothetical protein
MQKLQRDANQEMVAAVEPSDLTVERYNTIAGLVHTAEQTRNRLMRLVDQNGN